MFLSRHPLRCALFFSLVAHLTILGISFARPPEAGMPAPAAPVHALLIDKTTRPAQPQTPRFASAPAAHRTDPAPALIRPPDRPTPAPIAAVSGSASAPVSGPPVTETGSASTATHQTNHDPGLEDAPEGLSRYHEALRQEARRLKREYDRKYNQIERARQQGWEGRVEMNVRAGSDGTTVLLMRSSSHAALDQEALELIDRAVRRTVLPDALRGKPFELTVALEFRLNNEQGHQGSD